MQITLLSALALPKPVGFGSARAETSWFRFGPCRRRASFRISKKHALFSEFLFKKILFLKKFLSFAWAGYEGPEDVLVGALGEQGLRRWHVGRDCQDGQDSWEIRYTV